MLLPDNISPNEKLARIICGSSQPKKNKSRVIYRTSSKKYEVQVSVFLDSRFPAEVSVNRISTISEDESHLLGLEHRDANCPLLVYLGYAQVLAGFCRDFGCEIEKDDYNGIKPYHANLLYPKAQRKEDDQSIAVKLAFHSRFYLYDTAKPCILSV